MSETKLIREWLPKVVKSYDINSIADVGCGDQNWVQHVEWGKPIYYQGFDIANHGVRFDCTADVLPISYDLIMCIYVLNHLYEDGDVERAIELFRASGARYLLATYNDVEDFPLVKHDSIHHKAKVSGIVTRHWRYGVFKL